MAKNTNPLTKNLLIKQNWNSISLPITNRAPHGSNELFKDISIKKLIHGSFLKLGILTSEISFTKVCTGDVNIQFLYYPLSHPTHLNELGGSLRAPEGATGATNFNLSSQGGVTDLILPLLNLINLILKLKEPTKNYKFVCVKAANKFVDGKILNDYIYYMVLEDPSRLKNVVNSLLKEYKTISSSNSQ